ncbi:MAG: BamA/TamA family outer membrane protein [Chitinophagales bacterium]|nr:BamA/TamA family outer membrane protein [Chitinophagales bacterium]HAE34835.1 hypothetical protein [Bacteroidota bacterium]HPE96377.1 BamA/TamA family outer membrane protein [Chitinophagales bacterium]
MPGIFLLLFLSACSNARYLQEGEVLYKESKVTFSDSTRIPDELKGLDNDLARLSKLQPNKKVLGIYPLKMWLYNLGNRGFDQYLDYAAARKGSLSLAPWLALSPPLQPDSELREWLTVKVGEAPSLIDTGLIYDTGIRMENYLYNRGYFYPQSQFSVEVDERRHRATVHYEVTPNKLYRIRSVVYELDDPELKRLALLDSASSPLKQGRRFDVDFLKAERKRIADDLSDNGYLYFNKEYVYFQVDTTVADANIDVFVKVSPPENDSIHHRYKIRDIYILSDMSGPVNDTIRFDEKTRKGEFRSAFYILQDHERYTPKSLVDNVFINQGDYYTQSKVSQTIGAFSNLGMFKYATISTTPIDTSGEIRSMDLTIKLEPLPKHDITTEFNTSTTSEYLLANYGSFSYTRLNTFRRLDALRFSVDGGIESQITNRNVALNTSEFTTQVNLLFPRFFWPFSLYTPKNYYPRTITTLKLEYLDRVQFYTLFNTAFKYGSERFEGSRKQQLNLYPIDVNYVRVPRSTAQFDSILENNFLLRQAFQEQLILAPNATYILNTQAVADSRNDLYFRAGGELAGSLFFIGTAIKNGAPLLGSESQLTDPFRIFDIPFSNYVRLDLDFRDYFDINTGNTLVGRAAFGIAVPYWNSQVVPFVKQFYVGGANSLRAFPIRKVGPGSYLSYEINDEGVATLKPEDRTGDVKIEMNAEYRFDIAGILKGALFCDVGNVWSLQEDASRPGAKFQLSDFYKELAVGPGAGLRLDFSYFIFRLDAAYPLVDPAVDGPKGAYYQNELGITFPDKTINWNFAIGYPF